MSWLMMLLASAWSMPAQEAVDAAVAIAPSLDLASARVDEAQAVQKQTRGNLLPTVMLTGRLSAQTLIDVDMASQVGLPLPPGSDASMLVQPIAQVGGGLQLVQPLIAPQAWSGNRVAKDRLALAEQQVDSDESLVTHRVVEAWHNNSEAQALLADARDSLALADRLVDKGQTLVDLGALAPDQILSFQRAQASARAQVRVAEEGVITTAGVLQYLTGLAGQADLAEPPAEVPDLPSVLAQLDRPDLRAADRRTGVAERAISAERGGLYPTLAFVAGVTAQTPVADINLPVMWRVGLEAEIPLFQGGRTGGRIDSAGAVAAQAEAGERVLRQQAEVEVRAAHGALSRAMASLGESEEALRLADLAVAAAEQRFDNGGGSLLELQQAQLDRSLAQAQRTRSRATAARAADQLMLAVKGSL